MTYVSLFVGPPPQPCVCEGGIHIPIYSAYRYMSVCVYLEVAGGYEV